MRLSYRAGGTRRVLAPMGTLWPWWVSFTVCHCHCTTTHKGSRNAAHTRAHHPARPPTQLIDCSLSLTIGRTIALSGNRQISIPPALIESVFTCGWMAPIDGPTHLAERVNRCFETSDYIYWHTPDGAVWVPH